MTPLIRPVTLSDNPHVATVIREVMTEFSCVGDGYSIMDPEVDSIYQSYRSDRHKFWVIEDAVGVAGCGGIGPLIGGEKTICELKKMYFLPRVRGLGLGKKMIELCISEAKKLGYTGCYIETVDRMVAAISLYQKMGFEPLAERMGSSGHDRCETFFIKQL